MPIDIGLSLAVSGHADDPIAELPATIDAGVATSKAFMVFDFRLARRNACSRRCGVMGRHGGMLQVHCEDPVLLDAAVASALQHGDVLPRYHATTRPAYVEAVATAGRSRSLGWPRRPSTSSISVSAAALDEVRRAKAAGVRASAETCPHYLVLTDERYDDPDPVSCARFVISPPLRDPGRPRRPVGRSRRWRRSTWSRRTTSPTGSTIEKAEAADGVPFNRISNGAPGIETLLTILYSEGVGKGRITLERMVDLLATTPARRFGLGSKGALEVGRDADIVLFDPGGPAHDPRHRPPPHERLHAVRGPRGRPARSGASSSAVERSSATAISSGRAAPAVSSSAGGLSG